MRVPYAFSMKRNWGFIFLGKHDLNFYILYFLNAGPRLIAGLKKTPGQNCRFLINRRGHLIVKIHFLCLPIPRQLIYWQKWF